MRDTFRLLLKYLSVTGHRPEKPTVMDVSSECIAEFLECLSVKAVNVLLHSIDRSVLSGLRHLAFLSLLYDSGCRVQELIELNVSGEKSELLDFLKSLG